MNHEDMISGKAACLQSLVSYKYEPQTTDQVRFAMDLAGKSESQLARLIGINPDKLGGCKLVRDMKRDKADPKWRPIHYSQWRLLLLHVGLIDKVE